MKKLKMLVMSLLMMSLVAAYLPTGLLPARADETVILINNKEDWLEFADNCSYDAWSVGKTVELRTNLSLEEENLTPLGVFGGTFHGNGFTISGVNLSGDYSPAGLFGEIAATGSVEDLTVSVSITTGSDTYETGGIAGINFGTISNCRVLGSVSGQLDVGGITGINSVTGVIKNCTVDGIVSGQEAVGGVAGYNLGQIEECDNNSYVNTDSSDPQLNLGGLSLIGELDVTTGANTTASVIVTDIGGISGYNSGIVTNSRNHGAVGYPKVGYNVGGICGRSSGYVSGCTNEGTIQGRKDVGGVIGQAEPYVLILMSENDLLVLSEQLETMQGLVSQASGELKDTSSELANRLSSLSANLETAQSSATELAEKTKEAVENMSSGDVPSAEEVEKGAEEMTEELKNQLNAISQLNISSASNDLFESVTNLSAQASNMASSLSNSASALSGTISAIQSQASAINQTLKNLAETVTHLDEIVQDTSGTAVDEVTLGAVRGCTNSGVVDADLDAGGIVGTMGIEYTSDPEDDESTALSGTEKKTYELKCVVQACRNVGKVSGSRNNIGGIAGQMSLGIVTDCESYGDVTSESGSYVGGIAGITASIVRDNYVKCTISGTDAVGGVVGAGTESDTFGGKSTVSSNLSMVEITDCERSMGAISGLDTGTFANNKFVSDTLAGVNRVSRQGEADPVDYAEILEDEKLPEEFKTLTLRFVADGEILKEMTFAYGDSFTEADFPEIPYKEGYDAAFDRTDLTNLHFDTVVTAVYTPYQTAVGSAEQRTSGRSIFYVEGTFNQAQTVTAEAVYGGINGITTVSDDFWSGIRQYLSRPGHGILYALMERWKLEIPDDGQESHYVRYLQPSGFEGLASVYLSEDGDEFRRIDTEECGSYLRFEVTGQQAEIALYFAVPGWWVFVVIISFVVLIAVIVILIKTRAKRARARAAVKNLVSSRLWLKVAVIVLGVSVLGFAAFGGYAIYKGMGTAGEAYTLVSNFVSKSPAKMSVSVQTTVGDAESLTNLSLERTKFDGNDVTLLETSGITLYYWNEQILLENGRAYSISPLLPDYSKLLNLVAGLLEETEITKTEQTDGAVYSLTVTQQAAKNLLDVMLPAYKDVFPDIRSVSINITEKGGELSAISLTSSGILKDEDKSNYSIEVDMTVALAREVSLPAAVRESIADGAEAEGEITRDFLNLLLAWANLMNSNSLKAEIKLTADGGPLSVHSNVQCYYTANNGNPIRSVQMNDLVVYFSDDKICTADGIVNANMTNKRLKNIGKLPDMIYEICMDGMFDVSSTQSSTLFTISLDEDAIRSLSEVVAGRDLHSAVFRAGTIQIVLTNGSIERMALSVSGSLTYFGVSVPISLSADIQPETGVTVTIPAQVLEALEN